MATYEEFETNFDTEDEALQSLDALMEVLDPAVRNGEEKASVLNPHCYDRMCRVEAALRYVLQGQVVAISHKLNEPFQSMGSISVEGAAISFCSTRMFVKIAALASNAEVYPLTNGSVRLTFTFHGLTTPIA